jgi:hypothetical protein
MTDSEYRRKPIEWTTIILALIAAVTTGMAPITAYYLRQIDTNGTEIVELATDAKQVSEEIHTAVNSNYKAMMDKLEMQQAMLRDQNERILKLSVDKAKADEKVDEAETEAQP